MHFFSFWFDEPHFSVCILVILNYSVWPVYKLGILTIFSHFIFQFVVCFSSFSDFSLFFCIYLFLWPFSVSFKIRKPFVYFDQVDTHLYSLTASDFVSFLPLSSFICMGFVFGLHIIPLIFSFILIGESHLITLTFYSYWYLVELTTFPFFHFLEYF